MPSHISPHEEVVMKYFGAIIAVMIIAFSWALPSNAQPQFAEKEVPSNTALKYASIVADACVSRWEDAACVRALSESSLTLVSDYGAQLQYRKMDGSLEILKEHCAATTAATKQDVPAYAMESAMTECLNYISDIGSTTGVLPDLSHYQLMTMSLFCMGKTSQCEVVEQQMTQYMRTRRPGTP